MKPWRKIYRNIFENEDLGTLPGDAFQLFTALIIYADDEGRMKAGPAYLRGKAFRYRDDIRTDDIRIWRNALAERGFIQVYTVGNEDYVVLPNWFKWQGKRSDRFEPSEFPKPPKNQNSPNEWQPLGNPLATGWQPLGNPEEIREEKRRGEGEVRLPFDNDIHVDSDSDKGNPDAASPPSSASPVSTEPSQDKTDTTKKGALLEGQYPEADILAVATAYCELHGMAFVSDTTRGIYLKQKGMFYPAKDLLALNNGDVERTKLCLSDFAEHYEGENKMDWNWNYVLEDFPGWDEPRREYERKQAELGEPVTEQH